MIQLWEHEDLDLKQFAFLDTVTDTFLNLDGDECWTSVRGFLDSWQEAGEERSWLHLERFTSKLEAAGWEVAKPKGREVMRTEG